MGLFSQDNVVDETSVLNSLRGVYDPDLKKDIVSLGFVKDLKIVAARVSFRIELTTPACPARDLLQAEAQKAVAGLTGVESVEISMGFL